MELKENLIFENNNSLNRYNNGLEVWLAGNA
jgi:hypothetical protein